MFDIQNRTASTGVHLSRAWCRRTQGGWPTSGGALGAALACPCLPAHGVPRSTARAQASAKCGPYKIVRLRNGPRAGPSARAHALRRAACARGGNGLRAPARARGGRRRGRGRQRRGAGGRLQVLLRRCVCVVARACLSRFAARVRAWFRLTGWRPTLARPYSHPQPSPVPVDVQSSCPLRCAQARSWVRRASGS